MNIIKVILILCMVLAIDNIAAKDEKVNGTPILIQVELANPYYKGQIYRVPQKGLSMSYSDHNINFDKSNFIIKRKELNTFTIPQHILHSRFI